MRFDQHESSEQGVQAHLAARPFSRRRLLQAGGLAIAALAGGLALPSVALAASLTSQNGWRLCTRCQGLFLSGAGSVCPLGGTHSAGGTGYALFNSGSVPYAQSSWRWCSQCKGLWYAGSASAGRCPAWAGGHSSAGSALYSVSQNVVVQPGQSGWRWCNKCQGMFYGGAGLGACPTGGGHSSAGSANFCVLLSTTGSSAISSFSMVSKPGGYWVKASGGGFLAGSSLSIYLEHPAYGSISIAGATINASGNFVLDQSATPAGPSVACTTLKIAGTIHNSKTHIFRFRDSGGRTAYATAYITC